MKNRKSILLAILVLTIMTFCALTANAEGTQVLDLPADLKIVGAEAFYGATSLNAVVVPEGAAAIESKAFAYSSLQEISLPRTLTSIAEDAFEGCGAFKVNAPFGSYAFSWCMEHGYIQKPEPTPAEYFTYATINGLFARITGYTGTDTVVVIPEEIDDYIIQKVSDNTFKNNKTIEYVFVPDTVTEIGASAFYGCTSLVGVDVGQCVETIGGSAFYGCTSLVGVDFPDSLTTTGRELFRNCTNLEYFDCPLNWLSAGYSTIEGCWKISELVIPEGIRIIPNDAFSNCDNLTSIRFSNTVEEISQDAFEGCDGLIEIEIPGNVKVLNGFSNCNSLLRVKICNGVENIGDSSFSDCSVLTQIELPSTLKTIGKFSFANCPALTQLELPSGLERIGRYAFAECTNLQSAILPDSVTSIGAFAYCNCENLAEFHYPLSLVEMEAEYWQGHIFEGCKKLNSIVVPEGVTVIPELMFDYSDYLRRIELPSTLKTIGKSSFAYCPALTQLELPSGLEKIGKFAFAECTNLQSAILPDSVTSIGAFAYCNCENLAEFHYPLSLVEMEAEYWQGHIFEGCKKLNSIVVPEGVTVIPELMFDGCDYLCNIQIPSTVVKIGKFAFAECTNLQSAILPDSVTSIGAFAYCNCENLAEFHYPLSLVEMEAEYWQGHIFEGCKKLDSIVVPEGVTVIPDLMFDCSDYLRTIDLPSTVRKIGESSFAYCSSLESLYLGYNVTEIGDDAFNETPNVTIYTEYGSYALQYAKDNNILYYYLTPDGVNSPSGTLYKGDSYALYGYARASVPLTEITATIWDGTGSNVIQTITVNPAVTDYNLAGTVNTNLIFGTLPLGSYRYTLRAKTGISEEVWADNSFSIVPPPLRVYIAGLNFPMGYVSLDDVCSLEGTIISNYSISQVNIEVLDLTTNSYLHSFQTAPNVYEYSLSAAGIDFHLLSAGEYNLQIRVVSNGETRTPVNEDFVLGDVSIPAGVTVDASKLLEFVSDEDNEYIFNSYNADYTYKLEQNMTAEQQFLLGLRTSNAKLVGEVRQFIEYVFTGELKDYYLINLYKKEITNFLLSQGAIIDDSESISDRIDDWFTITFAQRYGNNLNFSSETMLKIAQSFVSFNKIRLDYLVNDAPDMVVTKDMRAVYEIINQQLDRYSWEFDRAEDLNEMGKKVAEICRDYAGGIAVLNDLEVSMSLYMEEKAFQEAIREMKEEYLCLCSKAFNKVLDFAAKEAVKAGTKTIAKYFLVGINSEVYVAVKISKLVWDTVSDLTGLYGQADSFLEYYSRCQMFYAAEIAYMDAFTVCHDGDMSEEAVGRLIRTFEYTKAASERMIKKARTMNVPGIIDSDLVQMLRRLERLTLY